MDKEAAKRTVVITVMLLAIMFILNQDKQSDTQMDIKTAKAGWAEKYESQAREMLPSYSNYIVDTEYYQLDDPLIETIANDIIAKSSTPEEAMQGALSYVYANVAYLYNEPDAACYAGTAASIIESGSGQCDTQTIVVVSILRKMGIAAKPVGGCLIINPSCRLQSFFVGSAIDLPWIPKYRPTVTPVPYAETFSRAGINSRAGGLHAWVTAWLPTKGWVTLEATNGRFANTECYTYHVEVFPSDNNKKELCVSTNWAYASACATNNLEQLDIYGLGTVSKVSPGGN